MSTPGPGERAQGTPGAVEELWRTVAHVAQARVAVLEAALVAVHAERADAPALRRLAVEESHKLVGSLDSYGRTGGSALALRAAGQFSAQEQDLPETARVVQALRTLVGDG